MIFALIGDLRKENAWFLLKWRICEEKTRDFPHKQGICKLKTCDVRVNWGILEEKTRGFLVKLGVCEEKMRDFRLNGGFSKRKRVIFA